MNNNEPRDTPITKSMMDAARERRLAYFAQDIAPAPRPARRDLPIRNRNHSRSHRAIR
jgi:hypothetical protein